MKSVAKRASATLGALLAENPLLPFVALAGFAASFQTIADLAVTHGLPGWKYQYPIGIDVGIGALIIESRRAIDDGRSDLVPRALAWLLSAFTIYVNAHGSPAHDHTGRALHIVMPALWVAFLEITRWRKIRKARKALGGRDRIPLAHWLAAPLPTLFMWRRMVLRNIKSYALAVELEDARRFARDLARAHYGKGWRRQAPRVLTARIRTGRLGAAVMAAAAGDVSGGWDQAVRAMVLTAVTDGDRLTVSVRQERKRIDRQDRRTDDRQDDQRDDRQDRRTDERQKPPRNRQPSVSAAAAQRAKVKQILTDEPGVALKEITERTGVSVATVTRVKREMRDAEPGHPKASLAAVQ